MNNVYDGGHVSFVIGAILYGLFILLLVAVGLVLAFLLARFLLVATRAAKIYVAKNGGTTPTTVAAPVAAAEAPTTAAEPAPAPVVPPTATTTKPVTKSRTPKTPPVE